MHQGIKIGARALLPAEGFPTGNAECLDEICIHYMILRYPGEALGTQVGWNLQVLLDQSKVSR